MTKEEMQTYAQTVADGGKVTRAELVKFMKAYLDPDLQAGGLAMTQTEVGGYLPELGFEIEKTETGIHVPREANRAYSKLEAAVLVSKIVKALE